MNQKKLCSAIVVAIFSQRKLPGRGIAPKAQRRQRLDAERQQRSEQAPIAPISAHGPKTRGYPPSPLSSDRACPPTTPPPGRKRCFTGRWARGGRAYYRCLAPCSSAASLMGRPDGPFCFDTRNAATVVVVCMARAMHVSCIYNNKKDSLLFDQILCFTCGEWQSLVCQ